MKSLSLKRSDSVQSAIAEITSKKQYWVNKDTTPEGFYDSIELWSDEFKLIVPDTKEKECALVIDERIVINFDNLNCLRQLGSFIVESLGGAPKNT
jgi:hypothetical protein